MDQTLGFVLNEEKCISRSRPGFCRRHRVTLIHLYNAQKLIRYLLWQAEFVGLSLNKDKTKYLLGGQ
jgi:hypothetical protein